MKATFLVMDTLALKSLPEVFDSAIDSGLFHVFGDEQRPLYVASIAQVLRPGGRYFMQCFSDQQPGDWGPRRVSQAEIRAAFAPAWRIDAIEDATFENHQRAGYTATTARQNPAKAAIKAILLAPAGPWRRLLGGSSR